MNLALLKEPFPPAEVSWRIGSCGKKGDGFWAQLLAYIDNRNIMDRLDAVCGPDHWCNEFKAGPSGGVICGISIEVAPGKWVTKWDGAENTEIESVKGGLSDSMKRAANQWGIGRYLYDVGDTWADCSTERKPGYQYAKTKDGGVFYWAVPREALARLGPKQTDEALKKTTGLTTADQLPKKVPADPEGNFDQIGYFRKKIGIENTPDGLDAALRELKANKEAIGEAYRGLLIQWFERAIDTTTDEERVKELLEMTFKAKAALGDDAYIKLGLRADKKLPVSAA